MSDNTDVLELKMGEVFYPTRNMFLGYEVVKITKSHYYLAYCKGSSSKIVCVSKRRADEFKKAWFSTSEEAAINYQQELKNEAKDAEENTRGWKSMKGLLSLRVAALVPTIGLIATVGLLGWYLFGMFTDEDFVKNFPVYSLEVIMVIPATMLVMFGFIRAIIANNYNRGVRNERNRIFNLTGENDEKKHN